jgi:hypothetical protein
MVINVTAQFTWLLTSMFQLHGYEVTVQFTWLLK